LDHASQTKSDERYMIPLGLNNGLNNGLNMDSVNYDQMKSDHTKILDTDSEN